MLLLGIDVGTTTTHFAVHRLDPGAPPSRGGSFAPAISVAARGPVRFTPWDPRGNLDGPALREIHLRDLETTGIAIERIAAGAALVTGEAARAANARAALEALGAVCGSMVPVVAGGWTESVLAGKGSGALADSRDRLRNTAVLDVGGGTSNIALFRAGSAAGACNLRLGGRMVRFDAEGRVERRTGAAAFLARAAGWECEIGTLPAPGQVEALAREAALRMVGVLRGGEPGAEWTDVPWDRVPSILPDAVYVTGGVGELFHRPEGARPDEFRDLGPALARALREVLPTEWAVPLPTESVRATVTGIGEHSLRLAGATVHDARTVPGPLLHLKVRDADALDPLPPGPLAWRVRCGPGAGLDVLRERAARVVEVARARNDRDLVAVLDFDLAKAFSVALRLEARDRGWNGGIVCLDGLPLDDVDLLDVGEAQEEGAIPVVARTLRFAGEGAP